MAQHQGGGNGNFMDQLSEVVYDGRNISQAIPTRQEVWESVQAYNLLHAHSQFQTAAADERQRRDVQFNRVRQARDASAGMVRHPDGGYQLLNGPSGVLEIQAPLGGGGQLATRQSADIQQLVQQQAQFMQQVQQQGQQLAGVVQQQADAFQQFQQTAQQQGQQFAGVIQQQGQAIAALQQQFANMQAAAANGGGGQQQQQPNGGGGGGGTRMCDHARTCWRANCRCDHQTGAMTRQDRVVTWARAHPQAQQQQPNGGGGQQQQQQQQPNGGGGQQQQQPNGGGGGP